MEYSLKFSRNKIENKINLKFICGIILGIYFFLFPKIVFCQNINFVWDIQKVDKGTLMYLDVPYNFNGINYLSFAIAKEKKNKRPSFISITLPQNVSYEKGIDFVFVNDANSKTLKLKPLRLFFNEIDDEEYKIRLINGYNNAVDDVFINFIQYKYLVVTLFNKQNVSKSVIVPLTNFRKAYLVLE